VKPLLSEGKSHTFESCRCARLSHKIVQMAESRGSQTHDFRSSLFEQLRILVSTRRPPPVKNADPTHTLRELLPLAVMRFVLISRCTRRAHAAFYAIENTILLNFGPLDACSKQNAVEAMGILLTPYLDGFRIYPGQEVRKALDDVDARPQRAVHRRHLQADDPPSHDQHSTWNEIELQSSGRIDNTGAVRQHCELNGG
jgi:hypothetical protein